MTDFESLRVTREEGHPPERELEALAFAPEGAPRASGLEEHLGACAACQARVEALREERVRFLQVRPARAFTARVLERGQRASWWKRPGAWALGMLPAAVGAALALMVALPRAALQEEETAGARPIRLKGPSVVRLELLLSRDGQPAVPLPEGVPLLRGDVLRFRVSTPEQGYVFIANLDDAGHFTRYFPASGARGEPLAPGEHVLPGSIVLDDWRGEERITLLFSPEPLEERDVEAALRRAFERAGGLRFEELGLPGQAAARIHPKGTR